MQIIRLKTKNRKRILLNGFWIFCQCSPTSPTTKTYTHQPSASSSSWLHFSRSHLKNVCVIMCMQSENARDDDDDGILFLCSKQAAELNLKPIYNIIYLLFKLIFAKQTSTNDIRRPNIKLIILQSGQTQQAVAG